jgi:transcriptional accessory protein Tex/SPT6
LASFLDSHIRQVAMSTKTGEIKRNITEQGKLTNNIEKFQLISPGEKVK